MRRFALLAAAFALAASLPPAASATPRLLDGFETTSPWVTVPASGVIMKLSSEPGATGKALRIDFDFQKGGGYAVVQRKLDLPLPANYRFAVKVRGVTGSQNFEFKLADASGENVWWRNRRDFDFPKTWQTIATRKRQIEFAWGPKGGGDLDRVASMEFAITAGSGGKGTVWLDDLTFEELPAPSATPPRIVASGVSQPPGSAAGAVDDDPATVWIASRVKAPGALTLDLGYEREFGGLTLDWEPKARAADYDVAIASEPGKFRTLRRVRGGTAARDWLYLPESEARWIRVTVPAADRPAALRELTLQPIEFGKSLNAFYEKIALATPRGRYPKSLCGEQQFWTVVGTAGGAEESFLSEDGAIDFGVGRPSLEPFLWSGERLWTWADVTRVQTLALEALPQPSVEWKEGPVELTVSAVRAEGGLLTVRYGVRNPYANRRGGKLFVAVRPFQVNPPAQFLNAPGGVCGLRNLVKNERGEVVVDGTERLAAEPAADAFGAATFDEGDVVHALAKGAPPARATATDSIASLASGAFAWHFDLAPGETREFRVRVMPARISMPAPVQAPVAAKDARISLPPAFADLERTLAAQIGWIEINRDGPAIQPGSRAYARSWIRDGALTCSALLRWGRFAEVKAFLEWFAPYQYADGKVPCCVDHRGSDPVPEHDSHGEFIYLAAEYLRHTGDRATVEALWPHVAAAAAYQDTLRRQRMGPEWREESKREFYGILPPSISHEGYSAKPMHSYWDDLWAVRGYRDAVFLARTFGKDADARRLEASLAEFSRDFSASIAAAQKRHGIAFVPGCADLGDFDATSTTMALSPVQATELAPPGAIEATFERYWQFFTNRRDGKEKWDGFTPYEIRNIGAFIRLGWRDRAQELTEWFMTQRSPADWAQWAEVVYNAPKTARFVGDIPHTWVGSDFVRSILDGLAYERESDDALVIAAGVPEAWIREGQGVTVQNLSTWHGDLAMTMRGEGKDLVIRIQPGLTVPKGGLVIAAPGITAKSKAVVNGKPTPVNSKGEVIARTLPATVRLTP